MTWLAQVVDTGNGEKQWIGSFPLPYACLSLPRCCLRVPLCGGFGAGRRARTGRRSRNLRRYLADDGPATPAPSPPAGAAAPSRAGSSYPAGSPCPAAHASHATALTAAYAPRMKRRGFQSIMWGIVVGARRRLGGAIGAVGAVRKPAR